MTTKNSRSLSLEEISKDSNLVRVKELLVRDFSPLKMYLFGSRASGQFRPDSDYDVVLVVKARLGTRLENMQKARLLLFDNELLGDVFVYTQEEFDSWKTEFSSIPEIATTQGVEIPLGNFTDPLARRAS